MSIEKKSISDLVMEYFRSRPRQDLEHGPVVDWVENRYRRLHGKKPRDTWRAIRRLHQEGKLIKIRKGIYRFDPSLEHQVDLWEFTPEQKEAMFERDGYQCVVCRRGVREGVEICADHIKPKDKGGTNTVDNGQTLCTEHNLMKKNYSQTEAGKRFFIRMYERAIAENDKRMIDFCTCVFECYNRHSINSHIRRPDRS